MNQSDAARRAEEQLIDRLASGRRHMREPQSAGALLSKLIARRGFTQSAFNEELQTAWQQAAGSEFAGKTQATLIRRGALEVIVASSPALQQLSFRKAELIRQLQAAMPAAGIRDLKFRVGTVHSPQS